MRRLLWLLAFCALAVGVSLVARFNEGYLLLVLPPYRVELSLNLALLLVILAFALLYALLRALVFSVSLPARVRVFRQRRRQQKAARGFADALRLLFEGRFAQALRMAAAQRLGEPQKAQTWLERARRDDPQLLAASLMLEAEMQLDRRAFTQAAETLQRLQGHAGRHIAARRLELRAQQGCGNWQEVLRLARLLEKHAALAPAVAQEFKLAAHRENIRRHGADLGMLLDYLRQLPDSENDPCLARSSAEALVESGAASEAQQLIEEQLARQWDSTLLDLYGRLGGNDAIRGIAHGENWLPEHPDDPQLLLALGRLCFAQRLWGKAQSYFEASLSLADQRATRLELARLLEQIDRHDEALPHYRAAAAQSA